jgi:LPS sulfotransferase NodH
MFSRVRELKRRLVNRRYVKFAILTEGRTGSTMLHTCLQQHANILSHSEVFNLGLFTADPKRTEAIKRDPVEYLYTYVFVDYARVTRAVGFKMLYSQCPSLDCQGFLQRIIDTGVRIIHLQRRNVLAMYVSGLVAQDENRWHIFGGEHAEHLERQSIIVSHDEYIGFVTRYITEVKRWDRFLRNVSHLDVYYEDLTADMDRELGRIGKFLGVRFKKGIRPLTKKRITQPLSEIVANYAELEKLFLVDK